MRGIVPEFHLEVAPSLAIALRRLAENVGGAARGVPAWSVLAGGTDVMVMLEAGVLGPKRWLGINGLAELRGIRVAPDWIELGALTTYTEVREHDVLRAELPSLCLAAAETGGLAIQNRGTIGGNIANASPAADTPPVLLVHEAEVELRSSVGSRWVKYADFHTGYKQTQRRPDELIAAVRLPRPRPGQRSFYRKVGTRKAQAISKVVVAGSVHLGTGVLTQVRLALGSVGPVTLRCARTEAILEGQKPSSALVDTAVQALATDIAPIDDIRSTAEYRHRVAGNVLRQFLSTLT